MTQDSTLAGRGRRLAATLVDMVLVPLLTILLIMVFELVEDAEDYASLASAGWVLVTAIASYLLLNGTLLWRHGQTVGKALLGIRMVAADGGKAPLWKLVCIRAAFFPLLFLLVLWPATLLPVIDQALIFTRRRRCLHDLAAGTRVVVSRVPQ